MNFMLFSVICLIIANQSIFAEEIECNEESKQKLDRVLMEMSTFGDPNGKYPLTLDELAEMCKIEREQTKWCVSYSDKCLRGLTQELMSLSLRDMERMVNKYCDSPRLSKLFISWSGCGNSALNDTVKHWQHYVLHLDRINQERERIPNDEKMPLICCAYLRLEHNIEEALISKGEVDCPQQAVAGLTSILQEIMGKSIDLFCGEYAADNDKCDAVHKKYNYLNDIIITKELSKSPVNQFIEIVTTAGLTYKKEEEEEDTTLTYITN